MNYIIYLHRMTERFYTNNFLFLFILKVMSHRPKNPPKFMKDLRIKKTIQAPPQPRGLTLSSWKLYNYSLKIIESRNYEGLKNLIDAIKILIKTIMKVRVDKEIAVDIDLFKKINNTKIDIKVGNEFIIDLLWKLC